MYFVEGVLKRNLSTSRFGRVVRAATARCCRFCHVNVRALVIDHHSFVRTDGYAPLTLRGISELMPYSAICLIFVGEMMISKTRFV